MEVGTKEGTQIVIVRCKEFVVVEIPIFIAMQPQVAKSGRELGQQILAVVRAASAGAAATASTPAGCKKPSGPGQAQSKVATAGGGRRTSRPNAASSEADWTLVRKKGHDPLASSGKATTHGCTRVGGPALRPAAAEGGQAATGLVAAMAAMEGQK